MSKGESNTPKGFSGLDDLLSNQDTTPPAPSTTSSHQSDEPVETSQPQNTNSSTDASPTHESQGSDPSGNKPIPSFVKWLVGGAIAFVVILVASNKDNQVRAPPQYSATPTATPAVPERVELLYESVPPVGKDLILNFVQLRFCIGEKIRLQALEVFGPSNVKRYNSKIDFYNQRCSSYRYRVNDFESVTQDMQARRDLLAEQARVGWFKQDELDAKSKRSKKAPVAVQIPVNGQLDYTGHDWTCSVGYRRAGQQCVPG